MELKTPGFILDYQEKTKHMTLKEKLLDYIWEYYKAHIIVTLIALFLIGSYINDVFINPPNQPYAGVGFYSNTFIQPEVSESISSQLNEILVEPESDLEIYAYDFFVNPDDPTMASAQIQRFMGMITSQEIDIAIVEADDFKGLIEMEAFLPLDSLLSPPELELYKDCLTLSNLGIDLEKYSPKFLKTSSFDVTNKVLGVIANTQRKEAALEIIKIMLQP